MLRKLIFNLKSMFLLMVCFLLISNALCFDNEDDLKKEIEEMMDVILHGRMGDRNRAFQKAAEIGIIMIPDLWEFYEAEEDIKKKGFAIRLIGYIIMENPYPDYEELLSKLLSIMDNKEEEDPWIVQSVIGALGEIKDVRIILPIIEALEYYDDIDMKVGISLCLKSITGNRKFGIAHNYTVKETKKVERDIREWYEKNKDRMFFAERGRLKYGDPSKYKPSDKPSDKAVKGFIDYVVSLFGIELDNDKKEVLKQQFIYFYQQKEFEYMDFWEDTVEYTTGRERTEGVKWYLEAIKSGEMQGEELWNSPQGMFCRGYEQMKELGRKNPAYELIHELCIDLFGDHYLFLGAEKIYIAGVEGVTYPERIPESFVKPKYPRKAKKEKIEGLVILKIVVKKNGNVEDLIVLRSPSKEYGFEESAIKAVKQWRYKPAMKNGQPVDAYLTVQVSYILE